MKKKSCEEQLRYALDSRFSTPYFHIPYVNAESLFLRYTQLFRSFKRKCLHLCCGTDFELRFLNPPEHL